MPPQIGLPDHLLYVYEDSEIEVEIDPYFHEQIQDAFLSHSYNLMIGHIIVIVV